MTRGNFTISHLDVAIDKADAELMTRWGAAQYDMRIMANDNTGRVYPIPKADAIRMVRKINAFKKSIRADMMAAAMRYKKGAR
jgi:hypothetical protein